jgi:hypothetical protein
MQCIVVLHAMIVVLLPLLLLLQAKCLLLLLPCVLKHIFLLAPAALHCCQLHHASKPQHSFTLRGRCMLCSSQAHISPQH